MTRQDRGEITARRMGRTWRMTGYGIGTALGLAVLSGLLGAPPRTGAAVFLLVSSLTTAGTSLYAVGTLILDDLHDRPTGRGRVYQAVGLFAAAAALMAMLAGVGG